MPLPRRQDAVLDLSVDTATAPFDMEGMSNLYIEVIFSGLTAYDSQMLIETSATGGSNWNEVNSSDNLFILDSDTPPLHVKAWDVRGVSPVNYRLRYYANSNTAGRATITMRATPAVS